MDKKNFLYVGIFLLVTICIFFSQVIFRGQIPIPGDLLVDTSPFLTQPYLGYAPGGVPNKGQGRDVIAQLYPWKYFSIQQFKNHSVPLWNPYNFSGNVHIGDYQTGVFYPLNIIFLFFTFPVAWSIFILLQPILGIIFMYLLLKDMKVHTFAALLGGFAFGFSSYMTVWLEWGNIGHTIVWLPLLLYAIRRFFATYRLAFIAMIVIAGVCSLLAGYIQGAFYVLVIGYIYGIIYCFRQKKKVKKQVISLTLCFIAMVVVSSIQILPTVAAFLDSTRGGYTQSQIKNLLQPWYYVVTIFVPDFFGNPATRNFYLPISYFERVMYAGIPMIFFAGYAIQKVRSFEIKFFAIVAVVVLVLTTNIPGVSLLYGIPLPLISTTVPTRLLSMFIFSIILLGSFGIDYWIRKKDIKSIVPVIFGLVYILLWVGILGSYRLNQNVADLAITKHNLILSTFFAVSVVVIFFMRYKSIKLSSILLLLVVVADLFYFFTKFTPFSSSALVFPNTPVITYLQKHQGIDRSWGYGSAYIPANYQTIFRIYSADGYDPIFNKHYAELMNSSIIGKVTLPLSRTDANIAPGYGPEDLGKNLYRQKILDLLGVKYVINKPLANSYTHDGTFPTEKYNLIWHDANWQIYENKEVYPRFFLANQYEIVNSQQEIRKIYTTDLKKIVLLSQKPTLPIDPNAKGVVRLITYQPSTVRLVVRTSGNTLLFLSDSYASGWKVRIDGQYVPLYRADVAFRAVVVPKGIHRVTFVYQPIAFSIGLVVSLLSIMIGGSFLLIQKLL